MGAGKSAVGRRLAQRLRMTFADSDAYIEERTGVDIAFIFEKEGEAGFRKRESDAIELLTHEPNIVLATGGGAILSEANRDWLRARGTVVYLHASVDQQYERVRQSHHRPLLQQNDPKSVLQALFDIRDPLYRSVADIIVATDGARVIDVAQTIAGQLTSAQSQHD